MVRTAGSLIAICALVLDATCMPQRGVVVPAPTAPCPMLKTDAESIVEVAHLELASAVEVMVIGDAPRTSKPVQATTPEQETEVVATD